MEPLRLNPARLTPEHLAFRETVRRFVVRELEPHVAGWDEAGGFPRDLYLRAAQAGLFGLRLPEEFAACPTPISCTRSSPASNWPSAAPAGCSPR